MWSFDVSFDLCLNKRLSKQSWGWWFETPSSSSWRHCNDLETSTAAFFMMALWYEHAVCITGPLWRETTRHMWIPLTKCQYYGASMLSLLQITSYLRCQNIHVTSLLCNTVLRNQVWDQILMPNYIGQNIGIPQIQDGRRTPSWITEKPTEKMIENYRFRTLGTVKQLSWKKSAF